MNHDEGPSDSSGNASRNLLFGIIALQNDFITREQLIAAFDSWVHDKSRSLPDILAQQAALPEEDRGFLDGLVARFLKKYGGDAEKSLAALSAGSSVRTDLERLGEPELQASLGHVGQHVPIDLLIQETVPLSECRSLGRFRILRPHAKGGLGQVSVALDQELNREVALKEIQPRHADNQISRERFVLEAEVTGGLEHPGIVPVYGLGQSADGRPFYAMRFVKGDSLKAAIEHFHRPDNPNRNDPGALGLELRRLLGLFIGVCNAVEYAHSRGVLHRDLKPGNIMVGKYGETLVVDWGLAKVAGKKEIDSGEATLRPSSAISSSGQTQPGSAIGTPAYMSPEQAAGKLDEIGPASDVYSLGATLYHVLCGKPPFEGADLAQILEKVRCGYFAKPTSIVANTPRGLEAICLKAMARNPVDRYPTARALADDVEHWLADEPLGALPDTLSDRVTRLGRRHKGAVRAAVAALILLALVSTIAALLVDEQRREKSKLADEMITLAHEKSELADSERESREKAMVALRTMTDDIIENQMARGITLTDENREFLQTIISQFEGFAAITRDDATSRSIRAEGYQRVGLMRHRLGELEAAERAYTEALAIQKQLAADFPSRPEFRRELAISYNNLGVLLMDTGRFKEAETAHTEVLAILKQLAVDFPTRTEFRQELAAGHNNLGRLFKNTGRLKEAEKAWTEALAIRKQLAANFPSQPEFRRELAMSHFNLGVLLMDSGRLQEAETAYTEALTIQKQLAADFPTRPELRWNLARSHLNLGILLQNTGRLKEAERTYTEGLAIQKELAADFPTRPEFRQELANGDNQLGLLLRNTGRLGDAETAYSEALAIQKQLAANFPTRPEFRQDLAMSQNNWGNLLSDTGRPREAETAYTEAVEIGKQLAADFPAGPEFRDGLARSHNNLGVLLQGTGRLQEAETAFTEALTIQKQLAADFADQSDFQNILAVALVNLGGLCNLRGDFQGAKARLEEAFPHHQAALEANPQNPKYRQCFGTNLVKLVQACAGLRDQVAALEAAKKLHDLGWDPPGNAYDAACALALCVPIVKEDQQLDAAKRESAMMFFADEAMKMLHAAVTKGFKDHKQMMEDTDLDSLRGREDFQKLIQDLGE
jgi:serine/threonine-protein kinase